MINRKIIFLTYLFPSYRGDIKGSFVLNRWEHFVRHSHFNIEGLIPTNYNFRDMAQPKVSFKIRRFYIFSPKYRVLSIFALLDYIGKSFFYLLINRPHLLILDYGYPEALFLAPIAKILKIKLAIAPKGSDLDEIVAFRLFLSKATISAYKSADYMLPLSDIMKKKLVKHGIPSKKITIIPQSFNYKLYDRGYQVKKLQKNDRIIVTMIGTFSKRQDLLIKIFPQLHLLYPNLEIWFIGAGFNFEKVKNQASFTNLIKFYGFVTDKKKIELLEQTSIYIHLSDHEGLPTAIMEVMYFGIPIIGSKVGGIPELLGDGCGLMVKNNENELIKSIIQLIEDESLRLQCISNAKDKIKNYLPNKETKRLRNWLGSIFQRK